jgi:ribosomal protein S18 acetylase RimI-like enzyme
MAETVAALPGQDTLLGSWAALAKTSPGATIVRSPTALAAVFPAWTPLNNAILLDSPRRVAEAASQLRNLYASFGVEAWALWLASCTADLDADDNPQREITGLKRDTTTLVMRATLSGTGRRNDAVMRTSINTATRAGETPIPVSEVEAPDEVRNLFGWVIIHQQIAVSCAWSFLHGQDCGIYAVETLPEFRRQGFARALLEHVLADAHARGARTASLQSTRAGQPLYEALGFTAVGRYEEWSSVAPVLDGRR